MRGANHPYCSKLSARFVLNGVALLALLAVAFALFTQYMLGMLPCAWCVFQRLIFLTIAVICVLSNLWQHRIYHRILSLLASAVAVGGAVAAWHQFSVASQSFSCDLSLADTIMSRITGLDATMPWLFGIQSTCIDAADTLLGVDYALWTLLLHVILAVVLLINTWRR